MPLLLNNTTTLPFNLTTPFMPLAFPFLVSWFITCISISAIGSTSGIILIFSLFDRARHSATNLLVLHILVVECINMVIPTTMANFAILFQQTHVPFACNCVLVAFFQILFTVLFNWLSTLLAINRLIAMKWPYCYKRLTNRLSLGAAITIVWCLSLATTIPLLFGIGGKLDRFYPIGFCGVKPAAGTTFSLFTNVSFTCQLAIQAICYGVIVCCLCPSYRATNNINMQIVNEHRRRRQRAISIALLVVFLWYLVCYLPIPIITTYFYWHWQTNYGLFIWLKTLLTCGSAGTPIILLSMSSEYQLAVEERMLQICSCIWPRIRFSAKKNSRVSNLPIVMVVDCGDGIRDCDTSDRKILRHV